MEIINLISICLKDFINLTLNNFGREDCSLKIDSVTQIHFTVINEIMSSYKVLDSFSHNLNIKPIFGKKIFIRSFSAPIASIEIVTDLLTCQNSDIFRKYCI